MIMNINWKPAIIAFVSLVAIVSMNSGSSTGIAGASQQAGNELAAQGSTIDQTSCDPRIPSSPCSLGPRFGYPAGELFVEEEFFLS
jgi:hypothetical protein